MLPFIAKLCRALPANGCQRFLPIFYVILFMYKFPYLQIDYFHSVLFQLIVSPPVVSTGTFVAVLRMLAVMCANCPYIAVQLLKNSKLLFLYILYYTILCFCMLCKLNPCDFAEIVLTENLVTSEGPSSLCSPFIIVHV